MTSFDTETSFMYSSGFSPYFLHVSYQPHHRDFVVEVPASSSTMWEMCARQTHFELGRNVLKRPRLQGATGLAGNG